MDQQPPSQSSPSTYSWLQRPQQNGPTDMFVPPAKRQRLSPNPGSPLTPSPLSPFSTSGNFGNVSIPNSFNQRQANGTTELAGAGTMGPPQRPTERERANRQVDINDLSDLVTSSGIDLREEENFLTTTYRNERGSTSFNTQSSQSFSPQNSFDLLSQDSFRNIGGGHGSFTQQEPRRSIEDELFEKHKKAARTANEALQYHLSNPFLWGASMRRHLERISNDNGVKLPMDGLFDRIPEVQLQEMRQASAEGSNGGKVTMLAAPSILNVNTPLEGILTLLSLATNERIRDLLEDAYGLARGRQSSADGVVPPEWSDLASGTGAQATTARPVSVTGSAWDADSHTLPSPPITDPQAARPSIAFPTQNSLTNALAALSRRDRQAEEARLKKRAARRSKKAAGGPTSTDAATPVSTPTGGATPQPSGAIGERAPEPKMTKKERERLAKQDLTEEAATRNANTMAAMQLGGRQYAWMKSASTPASKPTLGPRTSTTGPSAAAANASAGTVQGLAAVKDRKFGEWREDGVGGRGVQLRDWINVLEADGRERKTLGFAYARLGRERDEGPPTPAPGGAASSSGPPSAS